MHADVLLAWFRSACRDLPWRGPLPRDPYRVLVSEVMLQQTQVDRVAPVFRRFIARFPTVEALAAAHLDDVLAAFSGLGYYRRARLLHAAAAAVVERGGWPSSRAELLRLPGLGPYTSAAVAAFAFAGDDPPVDGNIARVAARQAALALPHGSAALLRHGEELARSLYAGSPTAEVWEALMELGATICTPAAPRCPGCPLRPSCRASSLGTPARYPQPRPSRATSDQRWVALWLERDDGRVLMRRNDGGPLFAGMWLPPMQDAAGRPPLEVASGLARHSGYAGVLQPLEPIRHSITHRRIEMLPFLARASSPPLAERSAEWAWHEPSGEGIGTSTLLAKLRRAADRKHEAAQPGRPADADADNADLDRGRRGRGRRARRPARPAQA